MTGNNNPPLSRWEERESEKICAIDIDGVLNNYPAQWLAFVEKKTGIRYENLWIMKETLPYNTYRMLKNEYRKAGEHMTAAAPFCSELTTQLSADGWRILIVTSRPFHRFPDLSSKTADWLEYSGIVYDHIISHADKHSYIISNYPHLKFMIEDNRYIANLVAKWGYKVYLKTNEYNKGEILPRVVRITKLEEIKV